MSAPARNFYMLSTDYQKRIAAAICPDERHKEDGKPLFAAANKFIVNARDLLGVGTDVGEGARALVCADRIAREGAQKFFIAHAHIMAEERANNTLPRIYARANASTGNMSSL